MRLPSAPASYVQAIWGQILELLRIEDLRNAKRDEANRFAGTVTAAGMFDAQQVVSYSGDLTPAQITANQNDYNPTNLATASVLRLSSDAARNITGLQGGADGRILILINVGSFNITLTNLDAASSAANQFRFGAGLTLVPDASVQLIYDSTSTKWRTAA